MEKVMLVCGSGDPDGISHAVCRSLEGVFSENGMDCILVDPYEMDIGHCTGCEACMQGPCTIDDDMQTVMGYMSCCDLMVLVTPIHFSGPSSIMKTFMDRLQPFWHHRDIPHPGYVAGVMCGGSPEPCFTHTESIIRAMSITVGMQVLGFHHIEDTDRRSPGDCITGVPGFGMDLIRGMRA